MASVLSVPRAFRLLLHLKFREETHEPNRRLRHSPHRDRESQERLVRSKQTAEMIEQDHALADLMGAANDSDVSPPKTKKLKTMITPDRIKFSVPTEFGSNMLIEFERCGLPNPNPQ